jgi:hypothetical protein
MSFLVLDRRRVNHRIEMNTQRDKKKIIEYEAKMLRTYKVSSYEWIDNLCFTLKVSECVPNAENYISIAKELFLNAGWHGDGEIELIWLPPFIFKADYHHDVFCKGVVVWHVKQLEDGTSWLLYPQEIEEYLHL